MRLTKSRLDDLKAHVISHMYQHQVFTALQKDQKEVFYQAMADTDPAANGMAVVIHSLPQIVRDQLPKISSGVAYLDQSDYNRMRGWVGKTLGKAAAAQMPKTSPFSYHNRSETFPDGKVFYSASARELRHPKEGDPVTLTAWMRVSMAKGRVERAIKLITDTAEQVRQLGVELLTLDELMKTVPGIKAAIPLDWTNPPEVPPAQPMLDPDTSAQLRKIILGDLA